MTTYEGVDEYIHIFLTLALDEPWSQSGRCGEEKNI
jgi:hypothetical protein